MDNSIIAFSHAIDVICEEWADRVVGEGTFYTPAYPNISRYKNITPYVIVTAVSGTAPTLDITLEGRYGRRIDKAALPLIIVRDSWISIYTFPQITVIGNYRQTPFEIFEVEIRYKIVVGGTTPSFTITLGNILRT